MASSSSTVSVDPPPPRPKVEEVVDDGNDSDADSWDEALKDIDSFKPSGGWMPRTIDEIDLMPIFAKEVTPELIEQSPELQAMQSILYSGPPDEVAENFKRQGNECLRGKKAVDWKEALKYYDQAVDLGDAVNAELRATIFNNRAQAHMQLGNYGYAYADALQCLKLTNNTNVKAFYRAAKSCFQVRKYKKGYKYALKGLKLDPSNDVLIDLSKKFQDQLDAIARKEAEEVAKLQTRAKSSMQLLELLRSKGIKRTPSRLGSAHWATVGDILPPHEDDESGELCVGCLLLYDEVQQTDFLRVVPESASISDIMEEVFPSDGPPVGWDKEGRYRPALVDVFVVDDHDSSKVPIWYVVPPNVPLSDVLRSEPFYLSDTLAILHVIPRGSSVAPTSFKKLS